jgi:YD repeat-containing protein
MDIEKYIKEFEYKFAKISHIHRGECVITDASGTVFQAHANDAGVVTEVGGLESIKDHYRATLTAVAEKAQKEIVCEIELYADVVEAYLAETIGTSHEDNRIMLSYDAHSRRVAVTHIIKHLEKKFSHLTQNIRSNT